MRRLMTPATCLAAALLFAVAAQAAGQEQVADQDAPSPEEIQKAFEAFATPGTPHAQFKRLVGDWKASAKSFHENPDEPVVTGGKATFRMMMGGRYLQQRFQGEFGGQKFTGMGISGYDNAEKKYVGVWIDNMGTGIMKTKGDYDSTTHQMVEVGTSSSPLGPMKMKMVSDYVNDDKFVFTMYMVTPAGEQKTMEIVYTRAESEE